MLARRLGRSCRHRLSIGRLLLVLSHDVLHESLLLTCQHVLIEHLLRLTIHFTTLRAAAILVKQVAQLLIYLLLTQRLCTVLALLRLAVHLGFIRCGRWSTIADTNQLRFH